MQTNCNKMLKDKKKIWKVAREKTESPKSLI